MNRGNVYWINLESASPPEFGKVRPGVVVSNSMQNEHLGSVVILPLSSRAPEIWPLRVEVEVAALKTSYVVLPGIRQVAKSRLHELAGTLGTRDLARVDEALALYLGD